MNPDLALTAVSPVHVDPAPGRSEYRVLALNTPQVMLRILGLFAGQDFPLDRVRMQAVDDVIWLALTIDGLCRQRAQIIAEKLRALVDTDTVDLAWRENGDSRRSQAVTGTAPPVAP